MDLHSSNIGKPCDIGSKNLLHLKKSNNKYFIFPKTILKIGFAWISSVRSLEP